MNLFNKTLLEIYQEMPKLDTTKSYDVTIAEHSPKRKRTIEANAYYWHLVNLLANTLLMNKDDVHREMLKSYGQRIMMTINDKDKPKFESNEALKYFDIVKKKNINGVNFTSYMVYLSSTTYDTKQMNILIKGVQQELDQQGIPYEAIQ